MGKASIKFYTWGLNQTVASAGWFLGKSSPESMFFPTCQVRVVRFYVSCLLLSSPPHLLLISSSSPPPPPRRPPPRPPRPPRPTATRDPQCALPDLNHDHHRPVFPAGPQPRVSPPSVPCRTSTTTIHAQCSLPDLNWAGILAVEVRQGTLGVDGRG